MKLCGVLVLQQIRSAVFQSESGKRLEVGGWRQNVQCQSSKSQWNSGMMEKWNDGINAKSSNVK
jgi:hypothetical protein